MEELFQGMQVTKVDGRPIV